MEEAEKKIEEKKDEHKVETKELKIKKSYSQLYDEYYRITFVIPILLLLISLGYLAVFYHNNGDIIRKDVSLTGGTTVTVFDSKVGLSDLTEKIKVDFPDAHVQGISDFRTGGQKGFFVETKESADGVKKFLENYLGYKLTQDNSSIEFSGSALSQGFYKQLQTAVLIAFVFMAIVVFIIFRTFIPSFAVVLSAFADIIMTLATANIIGMEVSIAGIVAFLMLIGYSVDTDILLTSRLLKAREGTTNERIFGAFKTGITMTLTAIAAVGVSLYMVHGLSDTLSQIFIIILIGLGYDILNTWMTNASILKWYVERKEGK